MCVEFVMRKFVVVYITRGLFTNAWRAILCERMCIRHYIYRISRNIERGERGKGVISLSLPPHTDRILPITPYIPPPNPWTTPSFSEHTNKPDGLSQTNLLVCYKYVPK